MEYVIVSFPAKRFVYIDGQSGGATNEVLRIEAGSHEFDLGEVKDYEPSSLVVAVQGTTVLQPMKIAFAQQAGDN